MYDKQEGSSRDKEGFLSQKKHPHKQNVLTEHKEHGDAGVSPLLPKITVLEAAELVMEAALPLAKAGCPPAT